jgi:hypothetical protein
MNPPARLRYQKEIGMTLSFFLSEAIHWTMNLMVNINWPIKPRINQKSSWNFGYRREKSRKKSVTALENVKHSISKPFLDLIMDVTTLQPPHHQEVDKRSHHPISNIIF